MAAPGIPEQLPFDLDTERCVLGSILRDPRCFPEVLAHLGGDDFYAPRHRELFQLLESLEQRSPGHCDAVSVAHEQERVKLSETLGGPAYLKELMASVPSIAFLENHIRIVRDLAVRRGLIAAADTIQRSVYDEAVEDVAQKRRIGRKLQRDRAGEAHEIGRQTIGHGWKHRHAQRLGDERGRINKLQTTTPFADSGRATQFPV